MDCVLCASTGHLPPRPSPELTNNCLNDLGSLTGQKFAHSLCQLLDLPPVEFQDKFLQPDISFCSSCTQSLSTIWILLDQLEQLQKQISEVRAQVTSRILEALQNNVNADGSNSSTTAPTHVLRAEISRVILHTQNSIDNSRIRTREGEKQTFTYGGIIEDTTVKEETEVDDGIHGEPEPLWCPMDYDCDGANFVEETEPMVNMNMGFPTLPTFKSKRTCKKADKAIEAMKQEICESKRVLRVSLRRLDNKIKCQGEKNTNVELKAQQSYRQTNNNNLNKTRNRKSRRRISRPQVEKTIPCTFADCPEKFGTIMSRHCHNRRVHSVVSLRCPHCQRTFKSQRNLDTHVRLHTGEKPYVCDVCGKTFRSDFYLRNHLTCHAPEDRRFQCPHCPVKCLKMHVLRVHLLVHTGEKAFMCELCSLSFKRKVELMNHQTNLHGKELNLNPFKCKFCGKVFHSAAYLTIHERTHTEEGKHTCHLCSFNCDRPSRLKHHLKTHSEERPFACTYCDKTYKYDHPLKIHIRSHTGERPFKCTDCPKAFKDPEHLKRHVAVAHSGLTPFKCPLCGDGFPVKKYLDRHTEKHRSGKIPIPLQPIIEDGQGQSECHADARAQEASGQVQTQVCEFQDLIGPF